MFVPDEFGNIWHRGTKIGLGYAIVLVVVLALFGSLNEDTPKLMWLKKIDFVVFFIPVAAGSQAYVAGRKDVNSAKPGRLASSHEDVRKSKIRC